MNVRFPTMLAFGLFITGCVMLGNALDRLIYQGTCNMMAKYNEKKQKIEPTTYQAYAHKTRVRNMTNNERTTV